MPMTSIPQTMQAVILVEQGNDLRVEEIYLPKDLFYGQVLIKIHYSGVCGSQLGEIDGVKGADSYLPHLLGHEGSGEVLEVGPGVKTVKPGDHAVLHWMPGDGLESDPPVYSWNGRTVNAGKVTTFNEYAIVSENRVTPIPKDFDLKIAPLFGCAVTTGLGVINNKAKVKIGESVVVFGAGGVGLNEIQGAAMVSAYPIVAVDIYDSKLELAKKIGASHLINSINTRVQDEIQSILGGSCADVVIDNTGNVQVIEMAYRLAAADGRIILVGVPRIGENISIYSLELHFGKELTGTRGGECKPNIDIPRYIRLHEAGKLKLEESITDSFSLSNINMAVKKMRSGETAGRCLIEVSK